MCNLTYFWQNNKNVIGYSTQSITFSLKARKRQFRQFLKYLTHCDVLWGREERQNSASTVSDCKASFLVVLYFDPLRITLQCFLGGPSLGPQSTWAPPCKTINHPSAWKTWDVAKKPINVTKSISIFFFSDTKVASKIGLSSVQVWQQWQIRCQLRVDSDCDFDIWLAHFFERVPNVRDKKAEPPSSFFLVLETFIDSFILWDIFIHA